MEIRHYFRILRRWWWLLLAAILLAAGGSYLATRSQPRIYSSRARVLVGTSIQSRNPDWAAITTAEQLAQTYAELATTRPVLQGVIDHYGLQTTPEVLRGMISVKPTQGTQILDITVVDTDPNRAAAIANAVAEELIRQSPGGSESPEAGIRRDVEEQLRDLKSRIDLAREEVQNLEAAILQEDSARAIAELKNRRDLLQQQISQWQATYAQLYTAYTGNQANTLTLVEPATPNYTPIGPQTSTNILLAGTIGALLAVGAILLLEYLDDTVKSGEEIAELTGLPFLGLIPRVREKVTEQLLTQREPRSAFAECFRTLRTNLQFSGFDHPLRTILVTSPQPTEGKSTVVANLGVVLAQAGRRVIVVDTDLRRPILHHIFGQENNWGLTGTLFGEGDRTDDGLLTTEVENLRFLPSGPLPPNPSEVLGSQRMGDLLSRLQEQADVVLLDSPPLLTMADANILAARVDGVVLVADAGRTRREALKKAAEALRRVGARILGVALNRVGLHSEGYSYYYYYSYYYSDEGKRRKVRRRRSKKTEEKTAGT
ncbi:MAG: polysaccharide biosynthesis tyrosine autokinase [Chloroflexia bacterium]